MIDSSHLTSLRDFCRGLPGPVSAAINRVVGTGVVAPEGSTPRGVPLYSAVKLTYLGASLIETIQGGGVRGRPNKYLKTHASEQQPMKRSGEREVLDVTPDYFSSDHLRAGREHRGAAVL